MENIIKCNNNCILYRPSTIEVGPGGQADLQVECKGNLIAQVAFRRGRTNNHFSAEYDLGQKVTDVDCPTPDQRRLIY